MPRDFANLEINSFPLISDSIILGSQAEARGHAVTAARGVLKNPNGTFWESPEWRTLSPAKVGPQCVSSWSKAQRTFRAGETAGAGHALNSDNGCLACGKADCACLEADIGGFRIWCAFCDHVTECYPDLDLAQREWRGGREALGPSSL